jgi:hypothetical protein
VSPCEQYSLGEMARAKIKFENQQKAITQIKAFIIYEKWPGQK